MAWTTPKTWVASDILTAAQLNLHVRDNLNYVKAGVTAFTPQVDQGATTNIAKTVNEGRYIRIGDVCIVYVQCTFTASGTAANQIEVHAPLTGVGHGTTALGAAWYYDASTTTYYPLVAYLRTSTRFAFIASTAAGGSFGASPNVQIASSDQIAFTATYMVV